LQKLIIGPDRKHKERLDLIHSINHALEEDYDSAHFLYKREDFEELARDDDFAKLLNRASKAFHPKEKTFEQKLGDRGEKYVKEFINRRLGGCFKCSPKGNKGTLRTLENSFPVVDLICDLCHETCQVKAQREDETDCLPSQVKGAGYKVLMRHRNEGKFHPLIIVLFKKGTTGPDRLVWNWRKTATIWYLGSRDVKKYFNELFVKYDSTITKNKRKHRGYNIKFSEEIKEKFIEISNIQEATEKLLKGQTKLFYD